MVITIKYFPFNHVIVNFLHKLMNQEGFCCKMDTNQMHKEDKKVETLWSILKCSTGFPNSFRSTHPQRMRHECRKMLIRQLIKLLCYNNK